MPRILNISLIILFFVVTLVSLGMLQAETLTVTTYYPSPFGSYQELTTTNNTYLATTGGAVGIGTTTPGAYKVYINGNVYVNGDISTDAPATYPDYVFQPEYRLLSLEALKKFIGDKKHLPNMPSAREVRKNGVKFFEQNRLMLEKLEEAYLYIIELENRVTKLEAK